MDFGYFVRPAEETGTGQPRVEPCLGYVLRLDERVLLFDSGMGVGNPEVESHYRPSRRSLHAALAQVGVTEEDVGWVVNCHLHFDHCGGNPQLPGRPVFAQTSELALARGEDYTLAQLIEFPGVAYEELDGEAEILPGVWVIPMPGHTAGHQSLAVRCTDGTVLLAGQAVDASGQLAWRARKDGGAGTAAPVSCVDRSTPAVRPCPCALRPRQRGLGTRLVPTSARGGRLRPVGTTPECSE